MNRATRTLIVAAFAALFAAAAYAQDSSPASSPASSAPASSSQAPAQTRTQSQPTNANGSYISIDPLAGVKYDNRWDVSVGLASGHIHAGPNLREGADLGGIDLSASYWLTKHFGLEASGRGYLGTSGTAPNSESLSGLFVAQYMFMGGVEYLGPHNKHVALIPHALFGGAYGDFNTDLRGNTPGPSGPAAFYDNQVALGGALGGHIDLNRSAHWVFRITPDALLTGYDGTKLYPHTQWNFGISVGVEYKFKKKR
ncbi:MAG TPA: hypothetical protein VHZ52_00935 [Acidobacteriaceae bacterium]|nr:hypothetical protein [Acidobacteriaceae bacterium]